MTYQSHGKHLVAGEWVSSDETFQSEPVSGDAGTFCVGTPDLVRRACEAAEAAFAAYANTSREDRAVFLETIAEEIEARAEHITAIGSNETGLPEARLQGERGRTSGQLRLFASHIRAGDYLDRRHDPALPDRAPPPRPDLKLVQRPIGPVAIFGASNFPLAFSVGGGDTASALAAGCPVVLKGHSAHPGTSEIVADAIHQAVKTCNMPAGVFSLIQGGNRHVGQALVTDQRIKAVGFTGSLSGGRALFDLCVSREEPIPFFGELGSVNPMFVLPAALSARGVTIADGWASSLVMGAGQFCTNPGIVVLAEGSDAERFADAARQALENVGPQTMLTGNIASAYHEGASHMAKAAGVEQLLANEAEPRMARPALYRVSAEEWLRNEELGEEVFGPLGLIVTVRNVDQMLEIARKLKGQLTATLHMDESDHSLARQLVSILEHKAGRVLANGFPTGVEVCDSMVHGGPYPASTNFGHTSVGTMAIRRFLRPVCYQNLPDTLLPPV